MENHQNQEGNKGPQNPEQLFFKTFGSFRIEFGNRCIITLPDLSRQQRMFISLLLIHPGHRINNEVMITALFNGQELKNNNRYTKVIARFRALLAAHAETTFDPKRYLINKEGLTYLNHTVSDLSLFFQYIINATALKAHDPDQAIMFFIKALNLIKGPLLEHFEYMDDMEPKKTTFFMSAKRSCVDLIRLIAPKPDQETVHEALQVILSAMPHIDGFYDPEIIDLITQEGERKLSWKSLASFIRAENIRLNSDDSMERGHHCCTR